MPPRTSTKSAAVPTWGWWVIGSFIILLATGAIALTGHLDEIFFASANLLIGILLLGLAVALYFIPALIASQSPRSAAIFVANFVFGWTIIGWIIILIWALAEQGSRNKSRHR